MDKLIYTAFNTVNNIHDNNSVRSQNLANVNVPGYRRDLGAKSVGTAFLDNFNVLQTRGLAIRDDQNYFESDPGTLDPTDNNLDIAIRGDGYFFVKGIGPASLSRRGDLSVSSEGILQNGSSHALLDINQIPIQVPPHRAMKVTAEGDVIIEPQGSAPGTEQVIGTLGMTLAKDAVLKKFRDGEIRLEDGSLPQMDDNIQVVAGHLEMSNVNITEELVQSIEDQRQYEINIKLISSASEMDEGGATLMRMPS
tara:strand:+ start:277 stop:1032 length:756 start_codon:yes stop_codon:yes gene_type:complete